MTELSALHVKITGDANSLNAALGSTQKGLETFRKSAETSAKVFERAFAGSEKAIDGLRRSIDPVYAASKRYEAAVETLNQALKMGTIQQGEYNRLLDQASAAMLRTSGQAQTAGTRFGFLGNMSSQTQGKIQQLGFQIQDVAVQLAAGTRATTVFAQQGSQILSIFGPVGAVLGTLAAVGLPLLGAAFLSAKDEARSFADQLTALEGSVSSLKAVTDLYSIEGLVALKEKYGEVTIEVLRLLEAQRAQALFQSQQDAQAALVALTDQYKDLIYWADVATAGGYRKFLELAQGIGLTGSEAKALVAKFQELNSVGLEDKPRILGEIRTILAEAGVKTGVWVANLNDAEAAIRSANAEGAKAGGWLATAIAGANNWAGALWEAAKAAAAARGAAASPQGAGMGRGSSPGGPLVGSADLAAIQAGGGVYRSIQPVTPTRGGDGGGGGENPYMAEVERLRESLLSKEEIELESYAKRQEALQAALEQRLITEDEYRRLSEEAQRQHNDKMTEIDVWRYGTGLDKAGAFFGGMADAMQGGNERMLAISKKFAAAEALINAWKGFSDVLADKTLPWYAKIPQAMAVLKAGMGAVNAIKGGGGGGGGSARAPGGGSSGGSQGQGAIGTIVNIALQGANYGEAQVRGLIEQINKAVENGAVLKGIRVV